MRLIALADSLGCFPGHYGAEEDERCSEAIEYSYIPTQTKCGGATGSAHRFGFGSYPPERRTLSGVYPGESSNLNF